MPKVATTHAVKDVETRLKPEQVAAGERHGIIQPVVPASRSKEATPCRSGDSPSRP